MSGKPFSDLDLQPEVLKALNEMGFKTMTEVQEKAIPHLLTSVDFLGQAPTGTGKTAAFGIPLVNRIEPGSGHIQALVIGPTRELVQQIANELNEIGQYKGVKTLAVFGGERIYGQKERLRERDIDIVVGTPGRLLDHIGQMSLNFSRTRLLVLDEADEMLDMGFREDIERIFSHMPRGRQTWLFSATMSREIREIADHYMMYPEEIRIQPQQRSSEMIEQLYYIVEEKDKPALLRKLLKEVGDLYGIVFCQTKRGVVELTRKFRDNFPVECIHGALPQSYRDTIMERFRNRQYQMLVATDVLARGIDVDNLTHIINYDPPRDPEAYIHRIGRTARAGETGVAITFFTPEQEREYQQLEKRIGMSLQPHPDNTLSFREGKSGRGSSSRRHSGASARGRSGSNPRGRGRSGGSRKRSGRSDASPPSS